MPYIHEGPPLYLAADEETIVEEGDPRAAFLLAATGATIPDDIVEKHGLKGKAGAPANKLRVGAVENKGDVLSSEIEPLFPEQQPEAEVTFTPAPAFEEAVNEEAPAPRRKGKTAE